MQRYGFSMEEASKTIDYFSKKRFARYAKACGYKPQIARQLYHANGKLSNAFRLLITDYLEVFLRNALDHQLSFFFKEDHWLSTKYDKHPGIANAYSIATAKKRLAHSYYTNDDLVTSLSFGFWTELFLPNQYKALKGQPIKIFTNRHRGFNRGKAYNTLNRLRKFRNRITHGEPILFRKDKAIVDLYYAQQTHKDIYRVLRWIDPILVDKVKVWDEVEQEMQKVRSLLQQMRAQDK